MYSTEHDKIIEDLKLYVTVDDATFGIFQYGGGADESYIKADKQGLRLFALELLMAAQKSNEILYDKEKSIIPIDFEKSWVNEDSDTFVQYVMPVVSRSNARQPVGPTNTIKDKLIGAGFIALMIFLILSMIVGVFSIIKWLL